MCEEEKISIQKFLFKTINFLASSAQGCITEPKLYGPFRLLDAISRLCEFPKYSVEMEDDDFLTQLKEEIDEKKFLVMKDEEAFMEFIKKVVRKLAREFKRRNSSETFKCE